MRLQNLASGYRQRLPLAVVVGIAAAAAGGTMLLSGCGSSNRNQSVFVGGTPTPTPTAGTGTGASASTTVASGSTGSLSVQPANSNETFNFSIPGATAGTTNVTITPLTEPQLPIPITRSAGLLASARQGSGSATSQTGGRAIAQASLIPVSSSQTPSGSGHRAIGGRSFTVNPNNKFIFGFKLQATGQGFTFTQFASAVFITGNVGSLLPAFTVLNVAEYNPQTNTWVDIGTVTVDANGNLTTQQPSATLPGILTSGIYVIYEPAAGTSTAVANFGIALIADEQTGNGALQVVHLYDAEGNAQATPTLSTISYAGQSDLDGEALTPDGSEGIMVDGSNVVDTFSGVQSGHPVAGTTLDVSQYGTDGDSVAIMPNGDTAVVALDSNNELTVVSGITSGNAHVVGQIPVPSDRDGVLISNNGTVLIARGPGGLTVFSIGPATSATTLPYTFTQVTDFTNLGTSDTQDGRDGVALDPKDSSKAVVLTTDPSTSAPTVTLLTGLPGNPVTRSLTASLPKLSGTRAPSPAAVREAMRKNTRVAATGATALLSVAIDYNGKLAVVGTESGLLLFSGVDTANLQQVGTVYSPAFTVGGQSYNITAIRTLGITLDNKYVVVGSQAVGAANGTLFTIPFSASGFAAPVGELDGVSIPENDQILLH